MKSGLEGRNNASSTLPIVPPIVVSMKSGLEGRNNALKIAALAGNGIRVSMKSGLEGRNNSKLPRNSAARCFCLNEVRPGRPEQYRAPGHALTEDEQSQ